VVDGVALPRHPFDPDAPAISDAAPMMIGTNKDEATLFLFRDERFGKFTDEDLERRAKAAAPGKAGAVVEALRAVFPDYSPTHLVCALQTVTTMWASSVKLAERKQARRAAPVFMYMLAWETPAARGALRSPHALEIPLVFDNVETARNFVGRGEEPQRLADQMAPAWLAFARTGDPNTPGAPAWPAYDTARRATMMFDLESRVVDDPWPDLRQLLAG
jgi:para-nitrobenzyl esterase